MSPELQALLASLAAIGGLGGLLSALVLRRRRGASLRFRFSLRTKDSVESSSSSSSEPPPFPERRDDDG